MEKLAAITPPPFVIPKPEAPSEDHLRALENLITRIEVAFFSLFATILSLFFRQPKKKKKKKNVDCHIELIHDASWKLHTKDSKTFLNGKW